MVTRDTQHSVASPVPAAAVASRWSALRTPVVAWALSRLLVIGLALTARLGREGTTTRGSEMSDAMTRFLDRFRRRRAAAGA